MDRTIVAELNKGESCSIDEYEGMVFTYTGKRFLPKGCCNHMFVLADDNGDCYYFPGEYLINKVK